MINVENEHTFNKALSEGINLFLGAGFSLLAKDAKNRTLPLGDKLKDELVKEFNLDTEKALELPQLCTVLEASMKQDFYNFLQTRFYVESFDEKYKCMHGINVKHIFSTNIDNLIHKIYENNENNYINDIIVQGPNFHDREAIDYCPLHGCILHENLPLTFSATDITTSFHDDFDKWGFLTNRIQTLPTLFWGYRLSDAGVLQAISPKTIKGRSHKHKWIIIPNENEAEISFFRALGFQIIIGRTNEVLDYIDGLELIKDKDTDNLRNTKELFPYAAIPEMASVPVSPIQNFYLGSPPNWFDVYSGNIHRTTHMSNIIDSINSGKHTIIYGIPACGKTTLAMLVATEINYKGHKLFYQSMNTSMTVEKAEMIINKLKGERALIFIDDFCDEILSFMSFFESHNIQLVGIDREYNFDVISHKIPYADFNVLDVSEISNFDFQSIFEKIPEKIRKDNYISPRTQEGVVPSIFEMIEANIIMPNLKERFSSVLVQLKNESEVLHDLFVLCCYVSSCRTPLSYDMASSFLSDDDLSYDEITDYFDTLGALLAEYSNALYFDQDYYTLRSYSVTYAVLSQVQSLDLQRVLKRFHEKVSQIRICNFNVFRRKAFDADIMKKAFSNWEDGRDFYEVLYERDNSPYIRQQGALYLAKKNRFREAFLWIEEALLQSRNKIMSIRHSHAIILFKANVNLDHSDEIVQQTLKQSLDILSDCYKYDNRKTYHVLTFADHSLQYWKIFRDDIARKYLSTSKSWLEAEKRKMKWKHRRIEWLLKSVNSRLSN